MSQKTRLTSLALFFLYVYLVGHFNVASSFTIGRSPSLIVHPNKSSPSWRNAASSGTDTTCLQAKKQSRSTLLNPINDDKRNRVGTAEDSQEFEEVYGAKFFGGSAVKEELFDEALEEQADKLIALYSNSKRTKAGEDSLAQTYSRFADEDAFDPTCRNFAQVLQAAINQALYLPLEQKQETDALFNQIYSPTLEWNTPFSRAKDSKNPLDELTNSLNFFKRVDVAIISAKMTKKNKIGSNGNDGRKFSDKQVENMQIRWEISVIWPNLWESRVLVSGTSDVIVDMERMMILSQKDCMDCGGKDGQDVIRTIAPQIQPRFWDLYHIGMTPSAEMMPRMDPGSVKRGAFSNYKLFEIPPRLVLQPTIVDEGGRDAREAEAIPNHAFTCVIKTTGSKAQRYTTTSPVEVSIRRLDDQSSSIISWNIPVTPEFVSYYDELPLGDVMEGATNNYCYQPKRLVATMPFGGYAQDKDVSDVRKKLYEQITRDGLKPKLVDGMPQFFFLNNDTKACFTADGGLGMAVYEWRPKFAKSNEVGIELEFE